MSDLLPEDDAPVPQLILAPASDDRDLARWGSVCAGYAQAYDYVEVSRDATVALEDRWRAIIVVQPSRWPGSLWTALAPASRPDLLLERIEAPTPEILGQILTLRVSGNARFGQESLRDKGPLSNVIVGLHGRGNGDLQQRDFDVIRRAGVNGVKLLSMATAVSVRGLLAIDPNMFIMVRPFVALSDGQRPRNVGPQAFFEASVRELQRLFDADPRIRHVEIHNEPNLAIDGWGASWQNGADFADWYLEVLRLYRQTWPDKLFGFPGLSPGGDLPGLRYDSNRFLEEAWVAVVSSDWVGVHSYWQSEPEMLSEQHGQGWKVYRRRFPDQQLWITEFGNPTQPKPIVGEQYVRYFNTLSRGRNIGGAFAYLSSISDAKESRRWAWVDEEGRDVGIAPIVARR